MVAGLTDMVLGLVVDYLSGGWGSPFWHLSVTSLMVPCLLLRFPTAMAVAAAYAGMYA